MLIYPVTAQIPSSGRGADIEIKLVTIGPGSDLTSWWGHTAVIVEDKRFNTSLFYNYGLFSFEQENFFVNFIMGRLIFWVGAWNTSDALAHYLSQNRDIRIQVLNLSAEQRLAVSDYLAWNVRPENRAYLYDHYLDNCSTRVRDLFDHILDGQFSDYFRKLGRFTFREHTRRYTHRYFAVDWILMFLMNDSIDQPIHVWDEMFLPDELENAVEEFTYINQNGAREKFVKSSYIYYQAKGTKNVPAEPPVHWPIGLVIGMLSGGSALLFGYFYNRREGYVSKLFALFHILIGFIIGIPGTVLIFMSLFTDHVVTYHNENILLANPITLLLIPLGLGLYYEKVFARKWLPLTVYFLWLLGGGLLLLKIFPAFDQFNWLSISIILPILISLTVGWLNTIRT